MSIEKMKLMKMKLMDCVNAQMENLKQTDTKELGEAIDMIKDLSEAIYYCTITEAMEDKTNEEIKKPEQITNYTNYYTTPIEHDKTKMNSAYRDYERNNGYMYYSNSNPKYNTESLPYGMNPDEYANHDPREGKSAMRRRMYMEGKEKHSDPNSQLKELEAYLQQLSSDITEMIKDASPEERATLHQKMTALANKLA